jgi:hypothetical protein
MREVRIDFLAATPNRVHVQTGDLRQEDVTAVPNLLRLHGRKPTPLLLVEPTHQQIDATVVFKINVLFTLNTSWTLALAIDSVSHDVLLVRLPGTRIMIL